MLDYLEYQCAERVKARRRRKPKVRFDESDVVAALESIFEAMLAAEFVVEEGEHQHNIRFIRMMQNLGIDPFGMEEPYLDTERFNLELQFTQTMEKLFGRVEAYLLERRVATQKTGISFYSFLLYFVHKNKVAL